MSRLRKRRRDELDEAGRVLFDRVVERVGERVVDGDGGLHGPFNAFVTAPHVGAWARLFETTLDRRVVEVAILTAAAHWRAEFAWFAHAQRATEAGVAADVIGAIEHFEVPAFIRDDERVAHAISSQLASTGRVDDEIFAEAIAHFGDIGMIEIVALSGYYALISYVLNAFDVDLPAGAAPVFTSR